MLLADLVAAADAVAATSSRNAKIAALAELIGSLEPDEIAPAVCFLSARPRQGKVGVGWAALGALSVEHAAGPSLEILDLDRVLETILATTGAGSVEERASQLRAFMSRATQAEADFVGRVLLGELRQGALEPLVADAVAKAAGVSAAEMRRAVMFLGDVGRASLIAMTQGAEGLSRVGLQVMRPVQPMLASTASGVSEALAATGTASVEWKLDGIRIQVHKAGDVVRIFTRNLNDITDRLPDVARIVAGLDGESFVLDGEAIGLRADQRPRAFQETMSGVGHQARDESMAMVPYFFDVIHLDGRDLSGRRLGERLAELERVAGPWRMPGIVTSDAAPAQSVLDEALAAGHEGVVVKAVESTYQAGRRGKSWRKVKVAQTYDLVVLACEWGHGRRRGRLSNLHLGARDGDSFVMVGKTFKGLTDEVLAWQTSRLLELETSRSGITVFVRPELVVEIALDGVQSSTRYPGGVALRFARVKRYREDKSPAEADTLQALRKLLV
jgi:DNA ligase-1